jgi:hypothetical protein
MELGPGPGLKLSLTALARRRSYDTAQVGAFGTWTANYRWVTEQAMVAHANMSTRFHGRCEIGFRSRTEQYALAKNVPAASPHNETRGGRLISFTKDE